MIMRKVLDLAKAESKLFKIKKEEFHIEKIVEDEWKVSA